LEIKKDSFAILQSAPRREIFEIKMDSGRAQSLAHHALSHPIGRACLSATTIGHLRLVAAPLAAAPQPLLSAVPSSRSRIDRTPHSLP
jgi:hypothetical protein